jgi:DinB superfamily
VITPETKNWTWVVDRECPECGFDASTYTADSVAALVRANALDWKRFDASGVLRLARPNDSTWSPLEYACHVRDVYVRYDARLALMLEQHDPLFANWDQDASAIDDAYSAQDAAVVVAELADAAEALAARLDGVAGSDWERTGRRSDGATFTVDTLSRYMLHDTIHHVWDVNRTR